MVIAVDIAHSQERFSREDIFSFVEDLSSEDKSVSEASFKKLSGLKSDEQITHLLQAHHFYYQTSNSHMEWVFKAIGEVAVPAVFSGSIDAEGTRKSRNPRASLVLTNYLGTRALPHLMGKIRNGEFLERKKAAWAIKDITWYRGYGDTDPQALAEALHQAAEQDRDHPYIRGFCVEALRNMKHEAALPVLIALLDAEDAKKVACEGLEQLGASAEKAVPRLKQGIVDGSLPAEAITALTAIAGPDIVPFIMKNARFSTFDSNDKETVARGFCIAPHPAAVPFMEHLLWEENRRSVRAARFFALINHPSSLKNLRKCLTVRYPVDYEGANPKKKFEGTLTVLRGVVDLKATAIEHLGKQGDVQSFPIIANLLDRDPSIIVRTAAARAISEQKYNGDGVIESLKKCLQQVDSGYSAVGHRDGSLHEASVLALSHISTDEAYWVLYQCAVASEAKHKCVTFWTESKDKKIFEKFLSFTKKKRLDDLSLRNVLLSQLRRHRVHYAIQEEKTTQVRDRFLISVKDPDHFGSAADMSMDGRYTVSIDYEFYTIGYAIVIIDLAPKNPHSNAHGPTLLYKEQGESWLPMQ